MAARYLPTNYVAMKLLNSCIILVQFLIATGGRAARAREVSLAKKAVTQCLKIPQKILMSKHKYVS